MNTTQRLISAGAALSNIAFNLAQREGRALTRQEVDSLDKARRDWDEARRNELREADKFKVALIEWEDKTRWVQDTAEPFELGQHRADVLKARIKTLEKIIAKP